MSPRSKAHASRRGPGLPFDNFELNAAVGGSSLPALALHQGACLTEADGIQSLFVNALADQIVTDSISTLWLSRKL